MLAPGVHAVSFFPSTRANTRGGLCKLKQIELIPAANVCKHAYKSRSNYTCQKGLKCRK